MMTGALIQDHLHSSAVAMLAQEGQTAQDLPKAGPSSAPAFPALSDPPMFEAESLHTQTQTCFSAASQSQVRGRDSDFSARRSLCLVDDLAGQFMGLHMSENFH